MALEARPAYAWYIQTADAAGDVGWGTSVAVDTSGYPRIAYYDYGNGHLKYAAWNGSSWDIQTVDNGRDVGEYPSLALDSSDYPRISYYDSRNGYLKYAAWTGSGWAIQTVDTTHDSGWGTSLALDESGDPHISYGYAPGSSPPSVLNYAAWAGSTWRIETVDPSVDVGDYTSIALDTSRNPHISYYDSDTGRLRYARWTGSTWIIETADSSPYVGEYSSLALDASDGARISYHDGFYGRLKYAARNGSTWTIQTVDTGGHLGCYTSLALDPNGYPRIGYLDWSNEDLKYASWNGSEWDIETVDSAGDVGWATSLALDAAGFVHIAYCDWISDVDGDLKYATNAPAPSHALPTPGYYMISFPRTPASTTVHSLLCDDLGCGNYYLWAWEGGGYQSIPTALPGCQSTTLDTREGYWILAPATTLDVWGAASGADGVLPLQTGWNMVAAPFEATIDSLLVDRLGDVCSLADAQEAGWVLATFYYSHDGTGSYHTVTIHKTPADRLAFWHAYWVLAGVDCSLIVPCPASSAPTGTGAASRDALALAPAWTFDVQASTCGSTDSMTIAAADGASEDFDGIALDTPKPPAAPAKSGLRMVLGPREPDATAPAAWLRELAMETKGTGQQVIDWQFTVAGGAKGEAVTLSWPELQRLPKDRVAILTDCDTSQRTFMRTRAQYEFAAPGDGAKRRFNVAVKPADQCGLLISSFSAAPLRGGRGAELTFSLSADATVELSVLNVAGRLVQRVREGLAAEAGTHTVTWAGRSLSATVPPNGLYLCVLSAKGLDGERARAVRPFSITR